MTAVVGFTCFDGVLLMADTEETTSTFTKSDCDKLYRFNSPSGTVLTGGTGDGHLIDCANQELKEFFGAGLPGTPDVRRVDSTGIKRLCSKVFQGDDSTICGKRTRH
jgi:hypothetical protein